jgi:very-short-patch-repair endonuclease
MARFSLWLRGENRARRMRAALAASAVVECNKPLPTSPHIRRLTVIMNGRAVADRRLMTQRARTLRRDSTDAEQRLWSALRNRRLEDIRFRRQVVLGRYVADFCSAHPKLVVELDGSQHEDQKTYDEARTRYLQGQGYEVLRFWNADVFVHLGAVLDTIADKVREMTPS